MTDIRKVYHMGDTEVVALDSASLTVGTHEIVALGPTWFGQDHVVLDHRRHRVGHQRNGLRQ